MKRLYGVRIYVDSVGLRAETSEPGVDPFVVAVMDEVGVDLTSHKQKTFDDLEDQSFDIVISLTPESQHRGVELARGRATEPEYWPTADPTLVIGQREVMLDAYRDVRNSLEARLIERFGPVRTFGG